MTNEAVGRLLTHTNSPYPETYRRSLGPPLVRIRNKARSDIPCSTFLSEFETNTHIVAVSYVKYTNGSSAYVGGPREHVPRQGPVQLALQLTDREGRGAVESLVEVSIDALCSSSRSTIN